MKTEDFFTIRQLVELTGLTEFTIRGWENRYSAFIPQRSGTGRRRYLKSDIERALLLRELLKRGHKISRIAKLPDQKLKILLKKSESYPHQNSMKHFESVDRTFELVALQKWSDLELFVAGLRFRRVRDLIEKFFLPVLQELATKVESGIISVSQEHILSAILKEKIYSLLADIQVSHRKPQLRQRRFVLAGPEGDHHEIGLLLAHLLIRSMGIGSLYLGAHTPSKDLAETALRFDASHILIVSTVSKKGGAHQDLLYYASEVHRRAGTNVEIFLAGSQAQEIPASGKSFTVLTSFQMLEELLIQLKQKSKLKKGIES